MAGFERGGHSTMKAQCQQPACSCLSPCGVVRSGQRSLICAVRHLSIVVLETAKTAISHHHPIGHGRKPPGCVLCHMRLHLLCSTRQQTLSRRSPFIPRVRPASGPDSPPLLNATGLKLRSGSVAFNGRHWPIRKILIRDLRPYTLAVAQRTRASRSYQDDIWVTHCAAMTSLLYGMNDAAEPFASAKYAKAST